MSQPTFARSAWKYVLSYLSIVCLIVLFGTSSGCADKTESGKDSTDTSGKAGEGVAPVGTQPEFHYLKIDSAKIVDNFFKKDPAFKTLVFNFKVDDHSNFPNKLTLATWAVKNNDKHIDCEPTVLDILPNTNPLSYDVLYSTLDISRRRLENIVGRDGTGAGRPYQYVVFVPYISDTCRRTLSYRISIYPKPSGGGVGEEDLNPCPPYRPGS